MARRLFISKILVAALLTTLVASPSHADDSVEDQSLQSSVAIAEDDDPDELPAEALESGEQLNLLDLDRTAPGLEVFINDQKVGFLPPSGGATSPVMSPKATWYACGLFDKKNKKVRTFQRAAGNGLAAGKSALLCGSEGWGYRHILKDHREDWEVLAAITGSNWRTFADWAINQAMRYPSSVTYRSGNDTYLYKTQVQIRDNRGKVRSTKYIKVAIARKTKNIITAFPSNK